MSMHRLLALALPSVVLFLGCNGGKIRPSATDCPRGCWTSDERCVSGDVNSECGTNGQWCMACPDNASCSSGACVPHGVYLTDDAGVPDAGAPFDAGESYPDGGSDAGTVHPNGPLGTLSLAPDFQVADWKPFDPLISHVAGLQSDLPNNDPKLYGLLPAQKEIRSLGTWSTYAVGAKMSDAAPPSDLANAVFTGLFIANRETVMVGYRANGALPKAYVFSETRAWGIRTIDLYGDYRAAPVGDFFSFSSNGVDNLSGNALYLFLGGPAVNGARKVGLHGGGAPANISWAIRDLTIVGVPNAAGEKLYACSWDKVEYAFNYFKPFNIEPTCLLIHQEAGVKQLAPLKSGLVVHAPSASAEKAQYIGISAVGPYNALVVTTTPAEPFLSGPLPGTQIEFITPYAEDVLVAVKDSAGRRLVRISRN